jgi:hypothetical protein
LIARRFAPLTEIERKLMRQKRMRIKQALVQAEVLERINAAPAGKKADAARSVLDAHAAPEMGGTSVSMAHQAIRGQAFGLMADFLDRFRSKAAGLRADKHGIEDVMRALFGENTTPQAKAFADAITAARNMLRGRFNVAGGDIVQRKDWGWVQRHDAVRMKEAGEDEWLAFTLPRLSQQMRDGAGNPHTAKGLEDTAKEAYASLITSDLQAKGGKFDPLLGSPVNARVHSRELVFKDATAWLEYQQRFGNPDVYGSIVSEIDRLAHEVAVLETLGPYPKATLEAMQNVVKADGGDKKLFLTVNQLFDEVMMNSNDWSNTTTAKVLQGNRNLLTASRLGSAVILAVGDTGFTRLTAKMVGLPQVRLFSRWLKQLSPGNAADRRLAARAGFVSETWLGQGLAMQRMQGETTASGITAGLADGVLRASGLSQWTEGGKAAFGLEFLGLLTDNAHLRFSDLPSALRTTMQRHGISEADWNHYRSTSIWKDAETGAEFIRPEDVWLEADQMLNLALGERQARFKAANLIQQMVHAESYYAIIRPTASSRTIARFGTERGSFFEGAVLKNAMLWKSFTVTMMHLHYSRMLAQQGVLGRVGYAAGMFVPMTLAGALAVQFSHIARGKDPEDMTTAAFWAQALVRGGALGPGLDLLSSAYTRHGGGWEDALLGPVLGGQTGAALRTAFGSDEGRGSNARRLLEMWVPGSSLWYARTAYERLLADQVQLWLDPHARQRFRRVEDAAKREGNAHYWRPGRTSPSRAPKAPAPIGSSRRSGMPTIGLRGSS